MDTTQTLEKNMDDYDFHNTKLSRTQGWESSYFLQIWKTGIPTKKWIPNSKGLENTHLK